MKSLSWLTSSLALGAVLITTSVTAQDSSKAPPAVMQPRAAGQALPAGVGVPADPNVISPTMKALEVHTKKALAGDYEAARWHPIHFKPAIGTSSRADCLTCHQEIMTSRPRAESQAGQQGNSVLAWYQTLDSYEGKQETFHYRHLESPLAKQVMKLECSFCHQGNDPREQSPHVTVAAKDMKSSNGQPPFTLRKRVNPSETCLRCHGSYPAEIMGLSGPWHEQRADLEPEGVPNGCLTCHANIRTERHKVSYLNADGIEKAAEASSDTCYGCHGGRQWYRISYPYPRNPWPDMDKDVPDWAKARPIQSEDRYRLTGK